MLKNVYEGLNARSTVYFCEMYPTCVSSELCEFIPVVDAFPRLLKRESGWSTFLIWLEREEPKLPLVNWESPFTRIHVSTLIFYIPNHPFSTSPLSFEYIHSDQWSIPFPLFQGRVDWKYPFTGTHALWSMIGSVLPHHPFSTFPWEGRLWIYTYTLRWFLFKSHGPTLPFHYSSGRNLLKTHEEKLFSRRMKRVYWLDWESPSTRTYSTSSPLVSEFVTLFLWTN